MAILTHLVDTEELAKMSPEQRQEMEDYLDGLIAKTIMEPSVMASLGRDVNNFAKKLNTNPREVRNL